ncbi:tRNA(fMet)-specific endonuclease VapC [compost metagenome]
MNGYLLDTNIAIALLAGEKDVLDFIRQASDDRMAIYFSVITECEVFSGIESDYLLKGIKLFRSRRCIEVSSRIARLAGDIRRDQRSKGRKLKSPDALIIATSIDHQLGLVSRDHDMSFVKDTFELSLYTI